MLSLFSLATRLFISLKYRGILRMALSFGNIMRLQKIPRLLFWLLLPFFLLSLHNKREETPRVLRISLSQALKELLCVLE